MGYNKVSSCEESLAKALKLDWDYDNTQESLVHSKAKIFDAWQEFATAKSSWEKLVAIGKGIFHNLAVKGLAQRSEQLLSDIETTSKENSELGCDINNISHFLFAEEIKKIGLLDEIQAQVMKQIRNPDGMITEEDMRRYSSKPGVVSFEDGDTVMSDGDAIKKRVDTIKANLKAEGLEEGTDEYNKRLANELYSLTNEFYTPQKQELTAFEALRERESEMDSTMRTRVLFDLFKQAGLELE